MAGIRGRKIEEALSMMKEQDKHILYLVTEDRDILENVAGDLWSLRYYLPRGCQEYTPDNALRPPCAVDGYQIYRNSSQDGSITTFFDENFYRSVSTAGKMQKLAAEKQETGLGDPEKLRFFILRDFHQVEMTLGRAAPYHLLYQFLRMASKAGKGGQDAPFPILFLISPLLKLPVGMESEVITVDVPEPDQEEIEAYLKGLRREKERKEERDAGICLAADDFRAMQISEIHSIYAGLEKSCPRVFDPDPESLAVKLRRRKISEHKEAAARMDSTVTVLKTRAATAGMNDLRGYISQKGRDFLEPEAARGRGIEPPRGILLTGVPGSGKTQAAKYVAYTLSEMNRGSSVPLVQFRMDNILGGLVGDSEQNFKRCRKRVEALAPCVVLFDEIEKTFAVESNGGNNDVKMNIFSALLDWMQETEQQIFFFATSNSVKELKPELLRDGRFSIRYSLFMPVQSELEDIIRFHLLNVNRELAEGGLFDSREWKEDVEGFQSQDPRVRERARKESAYIQTAKKFLDEIAGEEKPYFYTGANIKSLITETNCRLREQKVHPPYTRKEYLDTMLETAKDRHSQPYGITNMRQIVNYWIDAYENHYTDAGESGLLSFDRFDGDRFEKPRDEKKYTPYDLKMYQVISGQIEEEVQKRKDKEAAIKKAARET